jgi:GNAT superfamily N-acetyltransferase
VSLVLTRDAEQFAAATRPLLAKRIECNVIATVLINILDGVHRDPPPLFAYGLEQTCVRFAAMRTPPWYLLCSPLDGRPADDLVQRWLQEDPVLPGVTAPPATARAIASAWSRSTGGATRCRMSEAMHVLEEVVGPRRQAPGSLRVADAAERPLLLGWTEAFMREAGVVGGNADAMVDGRLRRGGTLLWDDGGAVSMLGVMPEVAGVVRIGPVYTPPVFRRRGYAGNAVAAAARRSLEQGAERCMLFTDLANPTSNKIYAEVGFRRVGDWEEHAFAAPAQPAG